MYRSSRKSNAMLSRKSGNLIAIRKRGTWYIRNPAVSRTHLLNKMTEPLKNIQILDNGYRGKQAFLTRHRTLDGVGNFALPIRSDRHCTHSLTRLPLRLFSSLYRDVSMRNLRCDSQITAIARSTIFSERGFAAYTVYRANFIPRSVGCE